VHPNPKFRIDDAAALRATVVEIGVVHVFAMTPDGPMVAHAPVTPTPDGHFRFHLARGNRIAAHLDGAAVIASAMGPNGYVSPDWYADPHNQVPTWNYISVEIEGVCAELDRPALIDQIDALSALHERRLLPKQPWTMAKVEDAYREGMLSALRCFELRVTAIRGNRKLSQNKSAADRAGVIAALGDVALARAMAQETAS
jgi:transcriptional regulator